MNILITLNHDRGRCIRDVIRWHRFMHDSNTDVQVCVSNALRMLKLSDLKRSTNFS
jgi:hypothetical protein